MLGCLFLLNWGLNFQFFLSNSTDRAIKENCSGIVVLDRITGLQWVVRAAPHPFQAVYIPSDYNLNMAADHCIPITIIGYNDLSKMARGQ